MIAIRPLMRSWDDGEYEKEYLFGKDVLYR